MLADTYFTPTNARIDIASTSFGRSSDYENCDINTSPDLAILPPSDDERFHPANTGPPQQEPIFGTHYWCQEISESRLQEWLSLAEPKLPPSDSMLALPPKNPFVPGRFTMKPLPPADCDHPLLNCSIKLQITVGKTKVWQNKKNFNLCT